MSLRRVIVVGGGAAGFFAAITCAESGPGGRVTILEKGTRFLDKVRISGGGRCNVTHACFDPREFVTRYPRGARALIGPFGRFSARETVKWFESRGVQLKTQADGRMFPVTDSSETIIDCLTTSARAAGVELRTGCEVRSVVRLPSGEFEVGVGRAVVGMEEKLVCDRVLLATGGCRAASAGQLAVGLGHTLEQPVPSLFTFTVEDAGLRGLAGVAVVDAEVSVPVARLRERGPLLVTHWGLSGPSVLRLSAWGARALHQVDYRFELQVNWLPGLGEAGVQSELGQRRAMQPAKLVVNAPIAPLSARLWEYLVLAAGLARDTRWASLGRAGAHALTQQVTRGTFVVTGKSLNKDEFVTCGGVRLSEVDFKTMESRVCPGLYFAGELLDVDGVTGGFNFQAAWTTGYVAGRAMSSEELP